MFSVTHKMSLSQRLETIVIAQISQINISVRHENVFKDMFKESVSVFSAPEVDGERVGGPGGAHPDQVAAGDGPRAAGEVHVYPAHVTRDTCAVPGTA